MKKYAVLGMDVEDWFHLDYFNKKECDTSQSTMDGLGIYLDLLKQYNIKTTFFIVGELVSKYEKELKRIIAEGHEIALHSYLHVRPLNLNIEDFIKDTERGLFILKNVLGIDAKGYRAPCFSLDRERLNILKDKFNLSYDSSKIKFDSHDLYGRIDLDGFQELRPDVYQKDNFFEFEASTVEVFGKSIPVSGGGYLRLFPWFVTKILLKKYLKSSGNYFFYIHPFEFSKNYAINVPQNTNRKTKFRFDAGRKSVHTKMHKLIKLLKENQYEFVTFQELVKRNS